MHGTAKRISLSMNVTDEITDRIYQRVNDQEFDIFTAALEECLEFLVAEIFGSYLLHNPTCGESDQSEQVRIFLHLNKNSFYF
jgi:hypothetical protein